MFHLIRFVDNDQLPARHDFLVAHSEIGFIVFVRREAVSEAVLEDAWDAYRAAWWDRSTPSRMTDPEIEQSEPVPWLPLHLVA